MVNLTLQKPLEDYIAFWQKLSSRSVPLLETLVVPYVRYTNPFHQIQGPEAMKDVLNNLYAHAEEVRIKINDQAWGRDGQTVYLRWVMTFIPKGAARRQWTILGVSEIMFGNDGRVMAHLDHWDSGSQLLSRLRFIGWWWAKIRARIAGEGRRQP